MAAAAAAAAAVAPPRAAIDAADGDADPQSPPSSSLAFTCQLCRARITLTGALDLDADRPDHHQQQAPHTSSSSRPPRGMDESFVVLPTTTAAAAAAAARAAARSARAPASSFSAARLPPEHEDDDDDDDPAANATPTTPHGMDGKLRALIALFEAASTAAGADHPLCLDCSARLKEELARQAGEAEDDCLAYEQALARLGRRRREHQEASPTASPPTSPKPATTPSAQQFEAELSALAAREAAARERSQALSRRLASLRAELALLEDREGAAVDASLLQYWQDASATQAALDHHVSERDALLARTERAAQRLAALRATSALNDACRIWHEGPFGTIGGFRLGRTPEQPVPWDEINAAWGLAVLLLSAMARSARVTFTGARRLLPLGSRARVADARGTHDLFGPVSRLWTAPYDRAMAAYVGCLAEFGEFARARDLAEGRDPPFEFPFAVDGAAGTVGGHSVRLALNKEARWTRALKLMLADLKVALQWAARREAGAAAARREVPRPLAPER